MKMIPESAVRRAMKVLEVILKAMAREIKWIQAADILCAMKTGHLYVLLTAPRKFLDKHRYL